MLQMLKRDFKVNGIYLLGTFLLVPLIYVINISIFFIYFYSIFFFNFYAFNFDFKSHVNQFLVSIPIKKNTIVRGRYVFLLISLFILMLYHWLIDSLAHYGLPYLDSQPLTGMTIILFGTGISLAMAISIPLYFFFKSLMVALSLQITLFFFGALSFGILVGNPYIDASRLVSFIFDIIEIQPFVIPILFSMICLYASYRLSVWSFANKDII